MCLILDFIEIFNSPQWVKKIIQLWPLAYKRSLNKPYVLFCFCWRLLSKELGIPIGILPMSGAGVDGNAPYQAQELQITTLANPGIQRNFLPPRPIQF